MDSSVYRAESICIRKATGYVGQNNVTRRQMYAVAMTGSVKFRTCSMLREVSVIVNRRMQLSFIVDSEWASPDPCLFQPSGGSRRVQGLKRTPA